MSTSQGGGSEYDTLEKKIRREELDLMQFEETRRYLVIQEKLSSYGGGGGGGGTSSEALTSRKTVTMISSPIKTPQYNPFQGSTLYQSVSLSSPKPYTPSLHTATPTNNNRPNQLSVPSSFQSPEFPKHTLTRQLSTPLASSSSAPPPHTSAQNTTNTKNFDAIVSWLAFPRNIFLKDRHSQQEYTLVIDGDEMTVPTSYLLKWYEINTSRGGGTSTSTGPVLDDRSVMKGYVYLQDIAQIGSNGSVLILQLASISRALKSSGGRTVLQLQFISESECGKYLQGIQSLQAFQRQGGGGAGGVGGRRD
jgi:hypothetical protein